MMELIFTGLFFAIVIAIIFWVIIYFMSTIVYRQPIKINDGVNSLKLIKILPLVDDLKLGIVENMNIKLKSYDNKFMLVLIMDNVHIFPKSKKHLLEYVDDDYLYKFIFDKNRDYIYLTKSELITAKLCDYSIGEVNNLIFFITVHAAEEERLNKILKKTFGIEL